ncbi:polysaccharide biosynthesis protein [Legionella sp. W05-934-2]|jgi:FlaA1/EpsC-like NDP-sugar epimerase|uniref:polysaccharide biosynthesis protein n=1 Tax=Legionella sp. W05-934-2 TaxID=1198649 RepID=UPI003462E100
MKKFIRKMPVLSTDLSLCLFAWFIAYWFRYNLDTMPREIFTAPIVAASCLMLLVQTATYYYYRVYRGFWRFVSLNDVSRIVQATISAAILVLPVLYWTHLLAFVPRSVLPLYCFIYISTLCGTRFIWRLLYDNRSRNPVTGNNERILIIGAGSSGESLLRDIKRTTRHTVLGFIDDDIRKRGLEVHGVPVLSGINNIATIIAKKQITLVFVAIPTASSKTMRQIIEQCDRFDIPVRTLPSLSALAAGQVNTNALRPVKLEDLLGRDEVALNWHLIEKNIQGKRVLVTGGGGSIGSELCRQVLRLAPAQLMIIDHSEFNLYEIERELQATYKHIPMHFILQSVNDQIGLSHTFEHFAPDIVFHAAAYKHVPMLQNQIRTAVLNNVIGTQIAAECAVNVGVDKFILISSDKAVNPTNVMGATKRIAELYCQNLNQRVPTQFITVRFGNVLGSAGSVVPLFQQQLATGGPLTVTHPDIERFFMTIPEACQLILQAMINGLGGEIFVLDMGSPIKIKYLAEQMIRLAGKKPGEDIKIEYTGLRPGEKLFEELFHDQEKLGQTAHAKLFKAKYRLMDWSILNDYILQMKQHCQFNQEAELLLLLKELVPEFRDNEVILV